MLPFGFFVGSDGLHDGNGFVVGMIMTSLVPTTEGFFVEPASGAIDSEGSTGQSWQAAGQHRCASKASSRKPSDILDT